MEESLTAPSVDPASVDPASLDPAAVDPASVDPAAVDPLAVDPLAVDPLAVDPASVDPLAVDPASVDPASVDPASVDTPAVDPASFHPPAVDPASVDPPAVHPASFYPPAVDPAGANPSSYPSWVLLDSRAYFADRVNATTVKATASTGHEFKVTFCLADPPAVSYFCVHCPEGCYTTEPRVVSSASDLVLLCFAFSSGPRSTEKDSHLEYFVYKAASDGKPTIRSVPCSPRAYVHSWHAAIVPGKGDNFLVADLSLNGDPGHYNLHIFSSETNEWSTKHVQLQTDPNVLPLELPILTDKVILLGRSTVGWVDLWRGIVVCNLLEKEPVPHFIPLPKAEFDLHRKSKARQVRDVIGFTDGYINFIEIEHCLRWFPVVRKSNLKTAMIFDVADTIDDAELLSLDDMDGVRDDKPVQHVPAGWKIRTMFRSIDWNYWESSHILHVDEISASPPEPSVLQSHLWNDTDKKWTLGKLKCTSFPTFGFYGGDVVYLVSKAESQDNDALLVGVDIRKMKLESIKAYGCGRSISFGPIPVVRFKIGRKQEVIEPSCGGRSASFDAISCAFSKYLNTAPSPRPCNGEAAAESAQNGV
uniref:DUF1618 domain-containing protein n=3 Tax=Aegilops tauschii subsp. strangulata TaxID=200361 RepID=A0A453SQN5_AEGTS